MKDKDLREALGMHGNWYLCGCDVYPKPTGEIPNLWRQLKELQKRVDKLEQSKGKRKK